VVVAVDDHLCAGLVERIPDREDFRVVAVLTGAEPRVMPIGEDTFARVGREVGAKPLLLLTSRAAPDDEAIRVEGIDPPTADVVGVPPLAGFAGTAAEVVEVPCRARRLVFVVSGRRVGPIGERALYGS
jgi:hypothetical protein